MPVIDVWAQPALGPRPDRLAMPEVRRLFARSRSEALLDHAVSPDELVALMDGAGVDRLLLSAWHRPGGWVISNDDIAGRLLDGLR